MGETGGSVDVTRTAGRRGDAPVERLTDLTHDDESIDLAGAQRPKNFLPRWRKVVGRSPKHPRNRLPGLVRFVGARTKILVEIR
jgi:hypothetical protein